MADEVKASDRSTYSYSPAVCSDNQGKRYSLVSPPDIDQASESKKGTSFRLILTIVGVMLVGAGLNWFLITYVKPDFRDPKTKEEMTWQPYVVMNSVAASIALMAIGLPADLILMSVSGTFCILKIINTEELLEGLSNSGVVAVALLCVVSKAVDKTKALNGLMSACLGAPGSTAVAMLRMALPVVTLGTVFNNTPLVAVMIPIVKSWTGRVGLEASHFMMPLSFITMLSACITTMGSSTNLLAVDLVPEAHIHFFDLAPVGFFIMIVGVAYCALLAPFLLPSNSEFMPHASADTIMEEDVRDANDDTTDIERYTTRFELADDGPLLSYSAADCGLLDCLQLPARIRLCGGKSTTSILEKGDEIELLNATSEDIASIQAVPGLQLLSPWARHRSSDHVLKHQRSYMHEISSSPSLLPVRKWVAAGVEGGWKPTLRPLFEVVISPGGLCKAGRTSMLGEQTMISLQEPLSEYNLTLVSIRGRNPDEHSTISLQGGEVLLVQALVVDLPPEVRRAFRMVLHVPEGMPPTKLVLSPLDPLRPVLSVLGLAACVLFSALHIIPLDATALLVGLSSILLGTLNAKEFYGAINGPVLLTVAASFGLGEAFAGTGVASFIAETVLGFAEQGGPYVMLGSVVCLALTLGVVVSNNTTVILLAPLVKNICDREGLNLKMMMLAVVYAANLSFATPFSYQTNMMVMPHGGYVFMDYVRFGVPMMLICGAVALFGTFLYWG